jgi:cytochrome c-type biogenesis protein
MTATTHITVGIAFLAGLVSFVSPCVLPLVPAYLSLLTGESVEDMQSAPTVRARMRTVAHAVAFVIGFSVIFVALGLSASALGSVLDRERLVIAQVGGVLVVIMGLHMMGMLRIPLFAFDTRLHVQHKSRTLWTSAIVGMAFAAGWSPCIGPILAGILAIASQQHGAQAATLLAFYCAGLALPFIATAIALGAALGVFAKIKRSLHTIEFAAGAFLIAVGLVLVNNAFLNVAGWFYQFVPQPTL